MNHNLPPSQNTIQETVQDLRPGLERLTYSEKNPNIRHLPLPLRVTAAAIALSGALSLAGCMNTREGSLEPQTSGPLPVATTEAAVPGEGFDMNSLEITNNGICAEPTPDKISPEDCRILPKITDGANFEVITEPDENHGVFDEKRVIAEIHGDEYRLDKLSEAYQEVLKNIFSKGMPKAALQKGTKFVFEQYSEDKEKFPQYISEIDTVRFQFATKGADVTVGELGAILEHESTHAVESKWDWYPSNNRELNTAYEALLHYSIDRITKQHGTELIKKLDEYDDFIKQEYADSKINEDALEELLQNSKSIKDLIDVDGLDAALVYYDTPDDYTKDQGMYVVDVRRTLFSGVSNEDALSLSKESQDKTREFNDILDGYMVDDFAYITEYRNLPGMVNWNLGHPWDNRSEYIASLFTIAAYAPNQLIANVNDIKDDTAPFVKTLVVEIARKFQIENPEEYAASNLPFIVEALNK